MPLDERTLPALPTNLTIRQVAQRMGTSYYTAWAQCKALGYCPMRGAKAERERLLAEIRALPRNLTLKEVAARLGIPYSTAHSRAQLVLQRYPLSGGSPKREHPAAAFRSWV